MSGVQRLQISNEAAGQRLDNYLLRILKGVPKSRIYRLIRKGEVRINGGRIQALYKLQAGDELRVPPVRYTESTAPLKVANSIQNTLEGAILYEDPKLIVLNKPASMASHGGSGLSYGVIEALRSVRGLGATLSLVHRLDQGTSGCLMIAKKRSMLRWLQEQMREHRCSKRYWALVEGDIVSPIMVDAPLHKYTLANGERRVRVDHNRGQVAKTHFKPLVRFGGITLLEALLETGRTHQIRVHCAHLGAPILGDEKYGAINALKKYRLCLHARALEIPMPQGAPLCIEAPLPKSLVDILESLSKQFGQKLDTLGIEVPHLA